MRNRRVPPGPEHWTDEPTGSEGTGRALLLAIGLHLLPLSWFAWQAFDGRAVPTSPAAAPIALDLAPLSAAAPAPPDQRVDEKRQEVDPHPEQPIAIPQDQTIEKTAAVRTPDVVLRQRQEAPTQSRQRVEQQQQAAAEPQVSQVPPAQSSSAPVAGASSNASAAQQTWESEVVAAIERGKRYPPGAQFARQEDTVLVRFGISHAGAVSGVKILRSRAYDQLDAEAKAVVRRVPLPPPPASIAEDPVIVTVPIQFYFQGN